MAANIDLVKHIQNLLFEHNKVTIPGLGTFSKKTQNAQINREDQKLEPPIAKLEFQDSLKLNDGVLVDYVSKVEDIPDYLVEEVLTKFVQNTLKQIDAGEKVQLGAIGTLHTDEASQNILLDTQNSINFSFDNFGLSTLELPDIGFSDDEIPATSLEDFGVIPEATPAPVTSSLQNDTEKLETADHLIIEKREEVVPPVVTPKKNKSVAEVLAEQAATNEGAGAVAAAPREVETTQKRKSSILWRWIIPLMILLLFVLLLLQLFSDKNAITNNSTANVISQNEQATTPNSQDNNQQAAGITTTNDSTQANNEAAALADSTQTEDFQAVTESRAGDSESTNEEDQVVADGNDQENNNNSEEEELANVTEAEIVASPPPTPAANPAPSPKKSTTSTAKSSSKKSSTSTSSRKTTSTKPTKPKSSNTSSKKTTVAKSTKPNYTPPKPRSTKEKNLPFNIVRSNPTEYKDRSMRKGYYVIVGAFRSRPSAKKLVDKIKREGKDAQLLATSNGYFRAGIFTGKDLNKTTKQFKESRRKHHKKAWVLLYE